MIPIALLDWTSPRYFCPTLVNAWRDDDNGSGAELNVDALQSRSAHRFEVTYVRERRAFEVSDDKQVRAGKNCRSLDPTTVRCRALEGAQTPVYLYGGNRRNRIEFGPAFAGYAYIETGGADDFVIASRASHLVEALLGKGRDTYGGSARRDNEGADRIDTGPGSDRLDGDVGRDILRAGPGDDTVYADDGVKDRRVDCGRGSSDSVRFDRGMERAVRCEAISQPGTDPPLK